MMTIVIKKFQQKKKSSLWPKNDEILLRSKRKKRKWEFGDELDVKMFKLAVLLEKVIERLNTSALNPHTISFIFIIIEK